MPGPPRADDGTRDEPRRSRGARRPAPLDPAALFGENPRRDPPRRRSAEPQRPLPDSPGGGGAGGGGPGGGGPGGRPGGRPGAGGGGAGGPGGRPTGPPRRGPGPGDESPRDGRGPAPELDDDLEPEREIPVVPVRRTLSALIAGFAVLLTVGLVVGAQTDKLYYVTVILGAQALFVLAWTVASRPPAPRVVSGVAAAAALAADGAALFTNPASLAPLAYVTAAAFVAGVVGQLSRPAGRIRVTESLASTLVMVLGVVAFATLIVLKRHPGGAQVIVACLAAAGVGVVVARVTDIVAPLPRLAPQVPRGGAGVVLGAMAGAAAAAWAGARFFPLIVSRTTIAGLVIAVVAVVVDLSVGYAEAGRQPLGTPPRLWVLRHMQGPLGAIAFAAPVAYAASALVVVPFL